MLQAQMEKEHKRRIGEKGKPLGMGVPDRDLAKSRNKNSRQKVWLCKHVKKISTFSKH
jgi:hypothetical protein